MLSLALAYLRDRPLTTALNVMLIAISVALLVLLVQLGAQAQNRFTKDAAGVDLVVGAKGSPLQLILSSIFHIDQPTGNIPASSLDLLRGDPAVKRAVPLALGDNFDGFRIVGTDGTFLDLYRGRVAQGREFREPMDALVGATVARETGAAVGQRFVGSHGLVDDDDGGQHHDHAPFTTVGILAPTGTVVDRLILTSVASVWQVHGIRHNHDHEDGQDHADTDVHTADRLATEHAGAEHAPSLQEQRTKLEPEYTALLVTYRNASGAIRIPAMINRQTEMQSAVPAVETARLLSLVGASLDGIRIFGWLLAATGGLAIFVALVNMARSREGDLALLRVMGASRWQVFTTVILEGVIMAGIGALLGWVAAHGLLALGRQTSATLRDMGLSAWQVQPSEAALLVAVLAIGAVAALFPAWRVFRIDPVRTLARSH